MRSLICYVIGTAAGSACCLMLTPACAQSPPILDAHLYAGLTITGQVGAVYSIEYVDDFAETNSSWRCLEYLKLPANPYLWTDKSAPAAGRRFYRAGAFVGPTNMVFIPPGTFRMGSPTNEVGRDADEAPEAQVTISRGLWMGKYEVTQAEYLDVLGVNPSYFQPPNATADLNRPVESVTWHDATNYCAVLTEREQEAGRIALGTMYRLPTEAEREYASRAWTSSRFPHGDDPGYTNLLNYAWHANNGGMTTHPVGAKQPSIWELYDLAGNVWEFCLDWYGPYTGGSQIDPQGPAAGSDRVMRGGSYGVGGQWCRSADRNQVFPESSGRALGFRVVLVAQPGP